VVSLDASRFCARQPRVYLEFFIGAFLRYREKKAYFKLLGFVAFPVLNSIKRKKRLILDTLRG
jgi:hypothetical protein